MKPEFYRIPSDIFDIKVIKVNDKYYSFGFTCRSFNGIWEEVKNKLDTLETCDLTDEDMNEFLVEDVE